MPTITPEVFRQLVHRTYKAAGFSDLEARATAESYIWATLRGNNHGFSDYVRQLRGRIRSGESEGLNNNFVPTIVRESPSSLVVDGQWGDGKAVTLFAVEKLIEKAKNTAIAAASIYQCNSNNALGYYVHRMADEDLIGMAFSGSDAGTPPWGGKERMLGTNPIAFGIPAKDEHPIILDWATASTSFAGVRPYLDAETIPLGYILDDDGFPTTDPKQFKGPGGPRPNVERKGSMDNMASNSKGYGIQLMVEMIGQILPYLKSGNDDDWPTPPGVHILHNPAFFIAINISFFQDVEAFKERVDSRIRELRASKKRPDTDRIYMPGERGFLLAEQRLRDGIPIPDNFWPDVLEVAKEIGADVEDLAASSQARS